MMDESHGSCWREEPCDKKYYCNRKVIIDFTKWEASTRNVQELMVVDEWDNFKAGRSLDYLHKFILKKISITQSNDEVRFNSDLEI